MRVHESIGCTISVRSRARHDIDLRGPFLRGSFHLGRGFQLMNGVDCLTTNAALGEDWWTLGPGQTRRFQFSYNAERPSHALYLLVRVPEEEREGHGDAQIPPRD